MLRLPKYLVNGRRWYHVGDKVGKWTVKEVLPLSEFDMVASKLEHISGGQLLHMNRSDQNSTFSVGFRTLPTDSTGLPHILEHTTLCGSKKYPCRDPFFNMLNRSLATFMNAMTGPDYTFYPFSTQNAQDFRNLQEVYLDAVFRPRLEKSDFRQEGWRLEHEDPQNSNSPITLKGVVYNEMKGVFSDSQNLFGEALLNTILPSNTYGVCSGGDPQEIVNLRHDDLVRFHAKHYTPGNARFYMYGNLPLAEYVESLSPYLDSSGGPVGEVPLEQRWSAPRRKHISCRVDPLAADQEKQGSLCVSFLCCDIRNIEETFVLTVLSQLLVDGPNAPFYRTLVEPGIGAGLSPFTGYESSTRDTFFTVGLQGVSNNDFKKIEEIIEQTLQNVVKEGFPNDRIEAVLHGIELGLKHQSANFGLNVLFSITPLWMNDGNVVGALQIEKKVAQLRKALKEDPKYLQKKVSQYLLNNSHRLTLTMSPDAEYEEKQRKKEESSLKEKLSQLTENDKKRIYSEGLELLEKMKEDNKDVLPTLQLSDIPLDIVKVPVEESRESGVPIYFFKQPTNGVTYFRALLPTGHLPSDLQPYLPLFAHVLPRMGTKKRSFRDLDQVVSLRTGGLNCGCHVTQNISESSSYEGSLTLNSHCLDRNLPHMFELWNEVLKEVDFSDVNRFTTMVRSQAAAVVNSVAGSGHHYAMLVASSLVSEIDALQEVRGGMTQVALLKQLAGAEAGAGLSEVDAILKSLSEARIRCSVNALPDTKLTGLTELLSDLNLNGGRCTFEKASTSASTARGSFYSLPFDVSYAAKAVPTVPYLNPDFAALRTLTQYLTRKYLHPEVREKGGAYGGGAALSTSGILRFYSYRDPSPHRTLQVFDGSYEWLKKNPPTDRDIEEAKLGVFQQVDAPVAPGARGGLLFMFGVTDEMLQEHRLRLKAVTINDIMRVAEKYLAANTHVGRCVLGPLNQDVVNDDKCAWTTIES